MTISVFEFEMVNEETGDMIYPPARRRTAQALDVYLPIGEATTMPSVRGILVYNNSNSTGVHLRVAKDQASVADQGDPYLGPDAVATLLIVRKARPAGSTDALYLIATADT